MTFAITIDATVWRGHCDAVRDRIMAAGAALVPVIKGHGYGLGQDLLAREAQRLGVAAVAVGTVHEVASVAEQFAGDVIVLEPLQPADEMATRAWHSIDASPISTRVLRTIASHEGLQLALANPDARLLLEVRTSMRRFGFDTVGLPGVLGQVPRERIHAITLHLPLSPTTSDLDQAARVGALASEAGLAFSVSHLGVQQLAQVRPSGLPISLRLGTALWLGQRDALRAHGTVLAVQQVAANETVGYQQRRARRGGTVVVVSGGTAHGIGLAAPSAARTLRQRAIAVASGALEAIGRSKSPFTLDGHDLWFVETPHQHVSMLWLPRGMTPPAVGTQLAADVRFTTMRADVALEG